MLNFCTHSQQVFVEFNTLFRNNFFARRLVRSIFTAFVLLLWHKHTHITLYAGTKLSAVKILWKYSNYFHFSLLYTRLLNSTTITFFLTVLLVCGFRCGGITNGLTLATKLLHHFPWTIYGPINYSVSSSFENCEIFQILKLCVSQKC